ncbi:MAG: type 4a pilus biogenesis protein PilO [candidate division WOR-3 bacterium]|nr:type 4a pilus biogenesis protein PilO [candidate division WOR-3 bacterium]
MALLERRVLIIGLAVYVVLAVFAVFVLYQPRLKARQQNAAQAAQLQKQLDDTRARVKGIGQLRAHVAELQQSNAQFIARVVPRGQMLSMLRQLAQLAADRKVRFLEIAPPSLDSLLLQESPTAPLRSVPFMVTVQGRYIDIGQYVESLDKFPYFVRVPDFEVTAREDIRPEVEAKLLVNLVASSLATGGKL